jgi:hypothetical protein
MMNRTMWTSSFAPTPGIHNRGVTPVMDTGWLERCCTPESARSYPSSTRSPSTIRCHEPGETAITTTNVPRVFPGHLKPYMQEERHERGPHIRLKVTREYSRDIGYDDCRWNYEPRTRQLHNRMASPVVKLSGSRFGAGTIGSSGSTATPANASFVRMLSKTEDEVDIAFQSLIYHSNLPRNRLISQIRWQPQLAESATPPNLANQAVSWEV